MASLIPVLLLIGKRCRPVEAGPFLSLGGLPWFIRTDSTGELMNVPVARKLPRLDLTSVSDLASNGLSEIGKAIADATGDRRPPVKVPLGFAMASAGFMELAHSTVGRTPPISRDQVRKLTETVALDVSRLRDVYGFSSPIPLRDGIRRTLGTV